VEGKVVGPKTILVDGYNVIRNMPGLAAADRLSLAAGRESLLLELKAAYRHTPHRVIVVFDGNGTEQTAEPMPGFSRGQIVYTRHGETADAVLCGLAAREAAYGAEVLTISDDLAVRTDAGAAGSSTARVHELAARMHEPDKYRRRLAKTRAYHRDQWDSSDADAPPARRSGNPKKAPRRRG
jgi:predicted RNA-binding protein with PIN domain